MSIILLISQAREQIVAFLWLYYCTIDMYHQLLYEIVLTSYIFGDIGDVDVLWCALTNTEVFECIRGWR